MSDRLPPHDAETEKALLGCLMFSKETPQEFMARYGENEAMFYEVKHRSIFRIIAEMSNASIPIDIQTLSARCRQREQMESVGGQVYLVEVSEAATSGAGWAYFAEKLHDLYVSRQLLAQAQRLTDAAYKQNPKQALEDVTAEILKLSIDSCEEESVDGRESALAFIEQLEAQSKQSNSMGILTGFYDLDKKLRGLRPGQLVILAGRPGHGKTSLAMSIVERVLDDNYAASVFSLEMRHHELSGRRAALRSGISVEEIENFPLSQSYPDKFMQAITRMGKGKIRIFDKIKNFGHFRALARKDAHKRKPALIVVDYLQLFRGDGKSNRYAEVSEYSNGMKNLAKELDCPILCLSQLNRSNEREERAPRLSDLRDSGSIEQDADAVLLIHRNEKDAQGDVIPVTLELAKHRNGRTGKVQLQFRQSLTRFENPQRVIEEAA